MAIIKTRRANNFTTIPNALVNDSSLRWSDLGLLVYLLSKPETWTVRVDVLVKERKIGRDAVYEILKRLRMHGYARLLKLSNGSTEWTIYDQPNTENPDQANPYPENPDQDNPDQATEFKTVKNVAQSRMVTPYPENPDQASNPHESSLSGKSSPLVKKDISKEIYIDKQSKSKKSFTEFPSNFEVTIEMFEWAVSEGVPDGLIKLETQKFKDYCLSKGAKYKDWLATWRNWMRNSVKYNNYKKIA